MFEVSPRGESYNPLHDTSHQHFSQTHWCIFIILLASPFSLKFLNVSHFLPILSPCTLDIFGIHIEVCRKNFNFCEKYTPSLTLWVKHENGDTVLTLQYNNTIWTRVTQFHWTIVSSTHARVSCQCWWSIGLTMFKYAETRWSARLLINWNEFLLLIKFKVNISIIIDCVQPADL